MCTVHASIARSEANTTMNDDEQQYILEEWPSGLRHWF